MNEALILAKRQDIMEEVNVALEAFSSDVLHIIGNRTQDGNPDFTITAKLDDRIRNKLVLSWHWQRLNKSVSKEFSLSVNETAEAFVNRVKAYLFDLIIMYINL